jgi:hypothetical protein
MQKEFADAERNLIKLNNRLQTVNTRLQESFRRRIESLNSKNTKTHEIKLIMDKEENEK